MAKGPIGVTGTARCFLKTSGLLFLVLDRQWSFCHCHSYVTLATIDLGCNCLCAAMRHLLLVRDDAHCASLLLVRLIVSSLARGQTEKVLSAILILIRQIPALHTRLIGRGLVFIFIRHTAKRLLLTSLDRSLCIFPNLYVEAPCGMRHHLVMIAAHDNGGISATLFTAKYRLLLLLLLLSVQK